MSPQLKMNDEEKAMRVANCQICLLCKSHCIDCTLNWALKVIEKQIEKEKIASGEWQYRPLKLYIDGVYVPS